MPGLDITPAVPEGRQLISAYGGGGFRIAGTQFTGSVLVRPERTVPWPVAAAGDVTAESLAALLEGAAVPAILLVGCGPRFAAEPAGLRVALRARGAVLEWMDTGAACRTFNVLLTEERDVAAALIAVD